MPRGLLQLSPLQLQKELAVHGATLPYQLNLCPAIVVTFSTIVAYQKSQRNMHVRLLSLHVRPVVCSLTESKRQR